MAQQQGVSTRADALWDVVEGLKSWRLWAYLGLVDIRQRYRRSLIGPLWLALGLGATVVGIGLLYSQVLNVDNDEYVPFLAVSLWVWYYITGCILDGTSLFAASGHIITSVKIPYTTFVLRSMIRNLIVAAHGVIVVVGAFLYYSVPWHAATPVSLLGILLVSVNLYWIGLVVAMVSARFQDAAQIIIYLISLMLFLTPVIWMPDQVRPGSPFLIYNPLAQMLEIIRAPLLEGSIPLYSFAYVAIMAAVGLPLTIFAFARLRRFVPYWI